MTFDEKRIKLGDWLQGPDGIALWDMMCALRGPDHPSERPNMTHEDHQRAYKSRRARKFKTVEVIRHKAFFGAVGGNARHHADDHVLLPPENERDHFDRHVATAALLLGLSIQLDQPRKQGGVLVDTTSK